MHDVHWEHVGCCCFLCLHLDLPLKKHFVVIVACEHINCAPVDRTVKYLKRGNIMMITLVLATVVVA
jgi:hypothetical protein